MTRSLLACLAACCRAGSAKRTRQSAAVCLAACVCLTAGTPAQQQPTFRGGVNYIRVDLYPTIDGMLVTDLRKEEISLLEDGVPQQIDSFEHVRIPPGGPEELRIQPNSIRASQQAAADPRARVFVVFIDSYHMDVQVAQQLHNPIRRFLEEALGPDDLAAVITAELPTTAITFSRKTQVLSGILADVGEWLRRDATISPVDPVERMYQRCYGSENAVTAEMIARRRERLALDALQELTLHLGTIREERKTVLLVSKGWRIFEENNSLAQPSTDALPLPNPGPRRGLGADGSLANDSEFRAQCEADRVSLARMDNRGRIEEITGNANRGNVSFYPLSPLRTETTLNTLSVLRGLAQDTDGLAVVNTNDFLEPIRRIIADTSSYYLLGYQSTNSSFDGRFRRITVRVARPGVQVRARRGYRAPSAGEVRAGTRATSNTTASPVNNAVASALGRVASAGTPVPLRIRASAWARSAGAGTEGLTWVVTELDERTRREPAWANGGRAEVTVIKSDGAQVATRSVEIPKGSASLVVAAHDTAPLAPGDYLVRVTLHPAGQQSLAYTDTARFTVRAPAAVAGEPVMRRRGPQTGLQYVETADPRFRRNERLRLELPTSATEPATARLLDRLGAPLRVPADVSMRDDPSGTFRWIVVDVSLAPLAAGDYLVETTQAGVAQLTAIRIVQ